MTDPTAPSAEAEPIPKQGDVLAGKYRVERLLGRGGMGLVLAAEHIALRQRVALKMLLPDAARRGDATERFLREARNSVAITSEHVARVMDVGTLDSGEPFMVMELLTGSDLTGVLQQRGRLPVPLAVDFIIQACEAIAEAHALGIIHRDLKPANLFVTSRADGSPLVKVLDFGLSKVTSADAFEASLTQAGTIMGSPFYMSPEQVRSLKGLDRRSDIWSLGVILYQLLAGARPFESDALAELFLKIGADPAPPLRERRPDVPPALEAAVMRCLEKDPAARPQSVAELARSLEPFAPPDSRISVERIHRVLADDSLAARRASASDFSGTAKSAPAIDQEAATLALSPADAPPAPALRQGAQSGSMAALATPVAPPPAASRSDMPSPVASAGKRGIIIGMAAAISLGVIGLALVTTHLPGARPAAAPQSVMTAAPIETAIAAPIPVPPAPPAASTAPHAAPTPAEAPTASASASASASTSAGAPPAKAPVLPRKKP